METPTTLALPVRAVQLMEDRALVERAAKVTLPRGTCRVVVMGLAPVAVDRSLKVTVAQGRLGQARLVRSWRERPAPGGPDAPEIAQRARALEQELAVCADAVRRAEIRANGLSAVAGDLMRSLAEGVAVGRPASASEAAWDELDRTRAAAAEEVRAARAREAEIRRQWEEAKEAEGLAHLPEEDLVCQLELTLESTGEPMDVRASYLVPCAAWRPLYRATAQRASVLLESAAMIWQSTGEDWTDVALSCSTARPTLGTSPPVLVADRLSLRGKTREEQRHVDVSLREQDIASAGEAAAELPGVDDGGETRHWTVPGLRTVRSDGHPHRFSLETRELPATFERLCPAPLSPAVFLVALVTHTGPVPLLAGPVDLVHKGGTQGHAQLSFTAPGSVARLSFGSEDGLRVIRAVETSREEARLTGRRTTRHTVKLFVSSTQDAPTSFVVQERIPVSEVEEVAVEVVRKACDPLPQISPEGIARFDVTLPARGTRTLTFVWEMSASAKVSGV